MKILTFILMMVFSVAAVADNASKKIDQFVWDGPTFLEGLSIEQIRNLAAIEKETKQEEDNPFVDGEKIPYYIFVFKDGLEVYCRVVSDHADGPHVQLTSVDISSSKWPVLHELNVGQDVAKVVSVLGKPDSDEHNIMTYSGQTEEVSFHYSNGFVTRVVFQYYAD